MAIFLKSGLPIFSIFADICLGYFYCPPAYFLVVWSWKTILTGGFLFIYDHLPKRWSVLMNLFHIMDNSEQVPLVFTFFYLCVTIYSNPFYHRSTRLPEKWKLFAITTQEYDTICHGYTQENFWPEKREKGVKSN